MKLEDPPAERRRFELIGLAMGVVILTTAVAFVGVVIFGADDSGAGSTPTPTSTATASPSSTPVLQGVAITRPVEVRSGPGSAYAIVTRLAVTDSIHVLGRSADSRWLVVAAEARPALAGWIPTDAVTGIDAAPLPVIAPPGATPSPSDATLTPDLPDLVVSRVFSTDNVLWVEVLNQGVADATGEIRVSVDGTQEVALGAKPGEPLRPGQRVASAIPGIYLQLRRNVEVHIAPLEGREEEDLENNIWIGIVAPDQPNDVEILSAAVEAADNHLVVTIRNNSPIPIAGTFTVSVRETAEGNTLLGRERATVEIGSGDSLKLPFVGITEIDLTRVRVLLSTDSIDDAVLANNSYPR